MKSGPCKDCSERCVGCHSSCDKYISWKQERSVEQKQVYTIKTTESAIVDHKLTTLRKIRRMH